jgi:hypothetical protein
VLAEAAEFVPTFIHSPAEGQDQPKTTRNNPERVVCARPAHVVSSRSREKIGALLIHLQSQVFSTFHMNNAGR